MSGQEAPRGDLRLAGQDLSLPPWVLGLTRHQLNMVPYPVLASVSPLRRAGTGLNKTSSSFQL